MTNTAKNGRTPWSAADVAQLQSMMSKQIDRNEIAAQLGRTEAAIQPKYAALQRQRNGRPKRQQRRYSGASFFLS